jgi:KaiC/GvpD/RAD55 family RecA-like ATPase
VFALSGVGKLTEISIVIQKAIRQLDTADKRPRRICLNILSDVLLQHGSVVTRKWLSELITALNIDGFTILGVINPQMHSSQDVHAILGLFDGEIAIRETETVKELKRYLKIRRMSDQKYLKNEILLTEG